MAPSGGSSARSTAYLVNHIALPRKVPQQDDAEVSHEQFLLDAVIGALQDLRDSADKEVKDVITSAIRSITNLDSSRDAYGNVNELQLGKLLFNLVSANTGERFH